MSSRGLRGLWLAPLVVIGTWTTSCAAVQGLVQGPCGAAAAQWGSGITIVGVFASTAGRIREAVSSSGGVIPQPVSDDAPAVLCYLDGEFPKAPPPDGPVVHPNYDRAMVVVVGDFVGVLQLGYKATLEIRDPN